MNIKLTNEELDMIVGWAYTYMCETVSGLDEKGRALYYKLKEIQISQSEKETM